MTQTRFSQLLITREDCIDLTLLAFILCWGGVCVNGSCFS